MVDLNAPLDLDDSTAEEFLSGIQGNIIKGHGRGHTAHLILKMTDGADVVKKVVCQFATTWVT